jgi:iron complex transport system substrate-binding protein
MSHKSLIPCLSLLLALLTVTSIYAQETAECEPGFRLFEHELLATDPLCIPEDPQRIAFIDSSIAYGVALGVESVTRSYYFDAFLGDFPGLVDEEVINAMVDIGDTWEMNAEALLLAEPDLIISATWWPEANEYAETIAPTVVIDHDRAETWLQSFDIITQIVGRTDVQEALLAGIDERLATLTELRGEDTADTTFTVTIIESAEQLWMFTEYNFGAQMALQAGLSFADTVPTPEEAAETGDGPYAVGISIEQLRLIDADHIFLFTNYADNAQEALFASPIWQRFAASDPERIHFLSGEYWVRDHPIAAHRVLDDLFHYVAGVDPAEVSPNPFAYTYQLPPTEEPSE